MLPLNKADEAVIVKQLEANFRAMEMRKGKERGRGKGEGKRC